MYSFFFGVGVFGFLLHQDDFIDKLGVTCLGIFLIVVALYVGFIGSAEKDVKGSIKKWYQKVKKVYKWR